MSGLFFRLAQQTLQQRSLNMKSQSSPVFAMQKNESSIEDAESVNNINQESLSVDSTVSSKTKDSASVLELNNTLSPLTGSNVNKTVNSKNNITENNNANISSPLTPVVSSSVKMSRSNNNRADSRGIDFAENSGENSGENIRETSIINGDSAISIQPQISVRSAFPASDSSKNKTNLNKKTDTEVLNKESSGYENNKNIISQPLNHSHNIQSVNFNKNNSQISQKNISQANDENQTTINISIGQIDIRATHAEKTQKKTSRQTPSSGTRSSALEQYHQKRCRGAQ